MFSLSQGRFQTLPLGIEDSLKYMKAYLAHYLKKNNTR